MAKKFLNSNNGIAGAIGTTRTEYITEDGKKVTETDYCVKWSKSGAATGAGIGYKIAGPPGAAAGLIIGGILGPAD